MKSVFQLANSYLNLITAPEDFPARVRKALPVYGASESFLAALHRFNKAKLSEDETELAASRLEGLRAILDALVDAGLMASVFGVSRLAKVAIAALFGSRLSRLSGSSAFDITSSLAESLLQSRVIEKGMDELFEAAASGVRGALPS